jgi:hypothetical protein
MGSMTKFLSDYQPPSLRGKHVRCNICNKRLLRKNSIHAEDGFFYCKPNINKNKKRSLF